MITIPVDDYNELINRAVNGCYSIEKIMDKLAQAHNEDLIHRGVRSEFERVYNLIKGYIKEAGGNIPQVVKMLEDNKPNEQQEH